MTSFNIKEAGNWIKNFENHIFEFHLIDEYQHFKKAVKFLKLTEQKFCFWHSKFI